MGTRKKLLACINEMKKAFQGAARIPTNDEEIRNFTLAYDKAYSLLVRGEGLEGDEISPRGIVYPCGYWRGENYT